MGIPRFRARLCRPPWVFPWPHGPPGNPQRIDGSMCVWMCQNHGVIINTLLYQFCLWPFEFGKMVIHQQLWGYSWIPSLSLNKSTWLIILDLLRKRQHIYLAKKVPLAITRWRGQKFRAAHNPRLVARSSIIILLGSSYRTNNSTCPYTESTADTYTHTHIFCFSEQ